jgi:GTP-binding protein HflX
LPPTLIASFQTTLSQTIEADILLHVVDISNENFNEHIQVVKEILNTLHIQDKPMILIMNKVDKLNNYNKLHEIQISFPGALFISAKKNIRLDRIREKILETITSFVK